MGRPRFSHWMQNGCAFCYEAGENLIKLTLQIILYQFSKYVFSVFVWFESWGKSTIF